MEVIKNIQALRAYGSLSVAVFHLGLIVGGNKVLGGSGVTVFFVLSGFVMAQVSQSESPSTFAKRRLVRILPFYWFATVAAYIANRFFSGYLDGSYHPSVVELIKSLLFIPYYRQDGTVFPVLYVGWSINYEMLFYAIVLIGIILLGNRGALLAIFLTASLMFAFSKGTGPAATLFGSPIMYAFCIGIVFNLIYPFLPTNVPPIAKVLIFTVALMAIPWLWTSEYYGRLHALERHSNYAVVLPVVALVFSTLCLSKAGWDCSARLVNLLGDASYVLYLSHPFSEVTVRRLFETYLPALNPRSSILGASISLTITVCAAVLLHVYVEKPLLRFMKRKIGTDPARTQLAAEGSLQPSSAVKA
jgi:peptidoglycan/LPS O-acetylase OafA/YrhL